MATRTACRRKARRFPVTAAQNVWVEFDHPSEVGRPHRLPLVDISVAGISFAVTDELPPMDSGASLPGIVIHVEGCDIRGEMLILHVTPVSGHGTVCGALFYPADDTELLKLKSVVSGIQAAHSA